MDEPDNMMRGKWRCSACGRINSMEYDNCCPRCMDAALNSDAHALSRPAHAPTGDDRS